METKILERKLSQIYGKPVEMDDQGVYTEDGDHFWQFTVGGRTDTAQFWFDGDECSGYFSFGKKQIVVVYELATVVVQEPI